MLIQLCEQWPMPNMVISSQYTEMKWLSSDQGFVGVSYMTKNSNTKKNAFYKKEKKKKHNYTVRF